MKIKKLNVLSLTLILGLVGCGNNVKTIIFPSNDSPVNFLSYSEKNSLSFNSLEFTKDYIDANTNCIVSPINFSLCIAGYALSSDSSENVLDNLGIQNIDEYKNLISNLNWKNISKLELTSELHSVVFNQIVDSNNKLKTKGENISFLNNYYLSTIKSSSKSAKKTFLQH